MRTRSAVAALAASLAGAGCVIVPVQMDDYDPGCRLVTHHIELQPVVLGRLNSCSGQGCEALVLASLGVTAVSAVVSGSIAIIGNVAYWAEHRAGCVAPPPPAPPPALVAPPAA